jgi:sodium-dependent dicarboxylate transporter 2/3/5
MPDETATRAPAALLPLLLGPLAALALLLLPAPDGMPAAAWATAAIAAWMAIWWATEAIPVPATALLPILLLPLLGVGSVTQAAAPFAHPLIFLFLGGFILATAIQRWNLHRRIALALVLRLGTAPARLVAGFMLATAILSMWVSNTATAMLMLPIALSVIAELDLRESRDNFARALLLGIAYAASIGGIGTLIGTPPNALLAAFAAERHGIAIGFAQWMAIGLPVAALMGPLCWLLLTRFAFPLPRPAPGHATGADTIARHLAELGPVTPAERRVALVFAATIALWLARPALETLPGLSALSDTAIALAAALALFALPAGTPTPTRLLDWPNLAALPWGTLILFGGGLSLAEAASATGLATWIGTALAAAADWPPLLLVAIVAATVVFLTEMTSNTATAATFLPLMGALALAAGMAPLDLMAPVAIAASAAFMLPVATPPNAIVFASGQVAIADMIRAGLWMNLLTIAIVTLLVPPLLALVLAP